MQHCLPQTPAGNCSGKPREEVLAQTQEMKEAEPVHGDRQQEADKQAFSHVLHAHR